MPRITRISGSLAAVLVAYWAYALMAVPWIEPPAPKPQLQDPMHPPSPGLDPAEQQSIDRAWLAESRERLKAFRAGELKALDGEKAILAITAELGK